MSHRLTALAELSLWSQMLLQCIDPKIKTRDMHKFLLLSFAILTLCVSGCGPTQTAHNATGDENQSTASTEPGIDSPVSNESLGQKPSETKTARVPVSNSTANAKNPAIAGAAVNSEPQTAIPKSTGNVPFSLKFLSWNVESEGSDPATIAKQLTELGSYDLIALTEVLPDAAADFCAAFGDNYEYVLSKSGRNDRMMLIYNKSALNLVRQFELDDINYKYRYRSPLVGHFKEAHSGKEMLIMVNHLARGSEKTRQIQAKDLVNWARDQTLPILALGDYNFDYVFKTKKGNEGFRLFMKDNIWQWIEPIELIDTNWYDNPKEPDGKDDYPGSMLDFGFVAGSAKEWTTSCKVIVRDGDFPDNEMTSDHRPFELIVSGQ